MLVNWPAKAKVAILVAEANRVADLMDDEKVKRDGLKVMLAQNTDRFVDAHHQYWSHRNQWFELKDGEDELRESTQMELLSSSHEWYACYAKKLVLEAQLKASEVLLEEYDRAVWHMKTEQVRLEKEVNLLEQADRDASPLRVGSRLPS